MKTILDNATRAELISRINRLDENSTAQWGKMNVYQMLKHCTLWEEMILGKQSYKRSFIGLLFGKMAMNDLLKNENPLKQSLPTLPHLKITENKGNIITEKQRWIELIEEHAHSSHIRYFHSFFGKMTKEQAGRLAYKHIDHHLRQFDS